MNDDKTQFRRNPVCYAAVAAGFFILAQLAQAARNPVWTAGFFPENRQAAVYEWCLSSLPGWIGLLNSGWILFLMAAITIELVGHAHSTRRRRIILGLYLALFTVFALFSLPSGNFTRERARRLLCRNHLRQLGLMLEVYAWENNRCYPDSLAAITAPEAKIRQCPSREKHDASDYRYHGCGRQNSEPPFIIIEDNEGNHPGLFRARLRSDGIVEIDNTRE